MHQLIDPVVWQLIDVLLSAQRMIFGVALRSDGDDKFQAAWWIGLEIDGDDMCMVAPSSSRTPPCANWRLFIPPGADASFYEPGDEHMGCFQLLEIGSDQRAKRPRLASPAPMRAADIWQPIATQHLFIDGRCHLHARHRLGIRSVSHPASGDPHNMNSVRR